MKLYIGEFFENLSRKVSFHSNLTRITGILHEDRFTFLVTCRSVLLRMINVSERSGKENQNTHFMFNDFFVFFSKIVLFMR